MPGTLASLRGVQHLPLAANPVYKESDMFSRIKALWKKYRFTQLDDDAYLRSYAKDTDRRVARDPQRAIGGLWDEMGELQFSFLESQGLLPQHALLDIGCGTLRGGRLFIPYLNKGNYTGIDVSRGALDAAEELCNQEGLLQYEPRLVHIPEGRLDFSFLADRYDFVLAQSVFSHLREGHISECLMSIHKVMRPGARFFFTVYEEEAKTVRRYKSFGYPAEFFRQAAQSAGLVLIRHPEYAHPRGQFMLEARQAT